MHSKVNVRRLCAGHYIMQCTLRHLGNDTGEYQSHALPEPAQNDSQHLATLFRTFRIGRKKERVEEVPYCGSLRYTRAPQFPSAA